MPKELKGFFGCFSVVPPLHRFAFGCFELIFQFLLMSAMVILDMQRSHFLVNTSPKRNSSPPPKLKWLVKSISGNKICVGGN